MGSYCAVQAKSTGQLSIVTYAFNVMGCLARMYTSHAEGGGFAMIRGFALGAYEPLLRRA